MGVKHTPDIDVIIALNVEDEVGAASQDAAAQPGKAKLVGMQGRSGGGVVADNTVRHLQRVDETRWPCRFPLHERSGQMPLQHLAVSPRVAGQASCSLALGWKNPISEAAEIALVNRSRGPRRSPVEQKFAQAFAVLIGADQLTDILAARGVAALGYLLIDEGFQRVWQRNVHRTHDDKVGSMAKFAKIGLLRKPAAVTPARAWRPQQGAFALDVAGHDWNAQRLPQPPNGVASSVS